jgi:lysophospholipid acyltransferase (LPLAT)-like uncharacterized protein
VVKKLKFIIYTRAFSGLAYYIIQLYSLTFRLTIKNEAQWMALLGKGQPVLLCTWHQQFFSAIRYFKTYAPHHPGLMISQSKDGDLIAGVANKSGWHTPRGSSSRGGKAALSSMINHLNQYGMGAHILDGPTGPIGKVKAGIIKMAKETRAVIVPFHVKAKKAWVFNSWDRFMLPLPFSKVAIIYDDPIYYGNWDDAFEKNRQDLETLMAPYLMDHPS